MQNLEVGQIIEGKIISIKKFGAFVELADDAVGLVHISEVSRDYVENISDYLTEGQIVNVKVLGLSEDGKKKKISLSIRQAEEDEGKNNKSSESIKFRKSQEPPKKSSNFLNRGKKQPANNFEDMMAKFKKDSDEKMNNLNQRLEGF